MNAERRNGLSVALVTLIAGLGISDATLADPADRDTHVETVTRTIDIGGLDLSSRVGAERLYREIALTAKRLCWRKSSVHKGLERAKQLHDSRRCFDEAVNGALAQVMERTGIDLARVAGLERFDHADLVAWR